MPTAEISQRNQGGRITQENGLADASASNEYGFTCNMMRLLAHIAKVQG